MKISMTQLRKMNLNRMLRSIYCSQLNLFRDELKSFSTTTGVLLPRMRQSDTNWPPDFISFDIL
ncbi:unnamed protein product [Brassica oleracea var. botrytis]